ncbi:hypothetical protein ES703_60428 [subsurface metagenome]
MKDGDIIVIDSVKELWDDKQQAVVGRVITDKAGNEIKVKKGQGGKLEDRWGWLDENAGKAIKLTVREFKPPKSDKAFPYVADFELVKDEFVKQAAEKVQGQVKDNREDSIESQVAFKGMVELISTGMVKADTNEYKATIEWAMSRLHSVAQIMATIEEAKVETTKTDKDNKADNQPEDEKQDIGQDSGKVDIPKTPGQLFTWIRSRDKNITSPRAWIEANYEVSHGEVLTVEKIKELENQIKKDKGW